MLRAFALLALAGSARGLAAGPTQRSARQAARELAAVGSCVQRAGESVIGAAGAVGDSLFQPNSLSLAGLSLARAGRDLDDAGSAGRMGDGILGEVVTMRLIDVAASLGAAAQNWPTLCDGEPVGSVTLCDGLASASAEMEVACRALQSKKLAAGGAGLAGAGRGLTASADALAELRPISSASCAQGLSTAAQLLADGGEKLGKIGGYFSGDGAGPATKPASRWAPPVP